MLNWLIDARSTFKQENGIQAISSWKNDKLQQKIYVKFWGTENGDRSPNYDNGTMGQQTNNPHIIFNP